MDIHVKSVDMSMDMDVIDVKFRILGKLAYAYVSSGTLSLDLCTLNHKLNIYKLYNYYRTFSTLQLESYYVRESLTTSPLTFEIDYIGCPFSRELNTECVS